MSTTMVPLKDMEEPIGMVTMVLRAAMLLRGRKDLEELIKWFGDQFVGLTNAEGTRDMEEPSGMVQSDNIVTDNIVEVQRDLEKLSDPMIILLVSTMMASAKDLEKPNGIVIVLLRGDRGI
jgi:hypothetical protein